MQQEFVVAFHARNGRIDYFDGMSSEGGHALGYSFDGKLMGPWIAHNSALADVFAAGFKLRFHQNNGFGERGRRSYHSRQNKRGGYEGNIHDEKRELWLCPVAVTRRAQ
jgi:hypothetical protein